METICDKSKFSTVITVLFLSIESILACFCSPQDNIAQEYSDRDNVFSGKVYDVQIDSNYYPYVFYNVVKIEVFHSWKGNNQDSITLYTGENDANCGYDFEVDSVYLVYADSSHIYAPFGDTLATHIYTDICRRTERLSEANADLQYLYTLSVEDLEPALSLIPNRVRLHQNFPNPFNPVTTIRYELPTNSHVNLIVYNILGKEIAVLGVGDQGPGIREIQWNASSVPSGVYFIQMQAGNFRQVRKVMVLK